MSDSEPELKKIEQPLLCPFTAKRGDKIINGSGEWQPLATQIIIKPEAVEVSGKTTSAISEHVQISFSLNNVASSDVFKALKNEFGDNNCEADDKTINVFHKGKEDISKILVILSSKNAITKHDVNQAVKAFSVENPIVQNNGFLEAKFPAANVDSTSRIIGSQKGLV